MSSPKPAPRRWSWSIGRLAGIDIRVHGTFLILLAWILISHAASGHGVGMALAGVLVVGVVFGVVVLHELGHALVARHFGIRTRDITLLPIGGIATLERMPKNPRQELLVALAGPAVNVALALLALMAIAAVGAPWSPPVFATVGDPLLSQFLWLNIALAVFNMLPAFPTDGGRVLRALLAMRMDRVRATDIAARIGQLMAMGLGLLGLFGNPMLVFIALFVWIGASEEASMVHMSAALESVHVADAMVTNFETVHARTTVAEVLELALHSTQRQFPVVDERGLVGIVSASDLIREVTVGRGLEPVLAIARPIEVTARPDESAESALEHLREGNVDVLAVMRDGSLVGLLLPQNVIQLADLRDTHRPVAA